MVLGFHGDSFTSICASEDSSSLMGGSAVVNVSDRSLTFTAGGRVPGGVALVGIVIRYTRLYIIGGKWGRLSNYCLMGPPPQCSGLYLVIGVNCNFSFLWGIHSSPCLKTWACHTTGRGHNTWTLHALCAHNVDRALIRLFALFPHSGC